MASILLPTIVVSDEDAARLHRAQRSSYGTCNCKRPGHCTRLEPCRHGRAPPSCARHHATSCKPVVVPCTTRVLNDSIEHEGGSSGSKCRSCGSCIEASRRRCRGCMSVGEADCEMTDSIDEPQVEELTIAMGRRPNHFPPTPEVWSIRYKLLHNVTDGMCM